MLQASEYPAEIEDFQSPISARYPRCFCLLRRCGSSCVRQHEVLIAVNGELLPGNPWRVHVTAHGYKYHFIFLLVQLGKDEDSLQLIGPLVLQ